MTNLDEIEMRLDRLHHVVRGDSGGFVHEHRAGELGQHCEISEISHRPPPEACLGLQARHPPSRWNDPAQNGAEA